MRRVLILLLVLLGLVALADIAAAAERRVALVVGNSSYPSAPLANPRNDANDVADALAHLGFDVIRHIDAGRNDINDALEEFQRKASDADAALFYYAGHAMQYNGQNYILPVDAVLRDQYSVPQLTSLSRVRDALSTCGECVKIMILDACRNNPLADQFLREQVVKNRSLSQPVRGLARLSEKPDGMIVVFATQAGDVASDGEGRNSPFTQALLTELKKPELGLSELFNDVALDVKTATGKAQVPEISYSAVRTLNEFYLNQSEGDNTAFDKLDFSDVLSLRHFIERYPESSKRRVVESLVAVMERQARDRAEEARREADRDRLQAEAKQKAEAEARRNFNAERARLSAEADAKLQAEAERAETDRLKQEDEAVAQRKLDRERVRLAAEADAKRQAEVKAEADRLKQEAEAEANRKLDVEHARLVAHADAVRQAEVKAEAERLRQEDEVEAKRKSDDEHVRLVAEADAKRQAEGKAEAERLKREAEAEAQRKLDQEHAQWVAEADAKRQADVKAEAERLNREAEAEVQRKLDQERVRWAAEAGAKQGSAVAPRSQGSVDATQRPVEAASVGQRLATRQDAEAATPPTTADASLHQDPQNSMLAMMCKTERAQFVALKQRGVPGLKALAAFKARLGCADMLPEVQAALEATSIRAASRRQSGPLHRTYAVAPVPRIQPGSSLQSSNGSPSQSGARRVQRSYREPNRIDESRHVIQLPPAPAVSASTPTVDFRGGGF